VAKLEVSVLPLGWQGTKEAKGGDEFGNKPCCPRPLSAGMTNFHRITIKSLELKIILAYGISISLLLSLGFMEHRTVQMLAGNDQWVEHTEEVLDSVDLLLTAFTREESAHSAYLVESTPANLQAWLRAQKETGRALESMQAMTMDNLRQQRRIAEFKRQIQKHRQVAVRKSVLSSGVKPLLTDWSARLALERSAQERLESGIFEMFRAERDLLAQRHRAVAASVRWIVAIATIGSGLTLALLLSAVVLIHRDFVGRRQAEVQLGIERDLLRALMENVPDIIYFKDAAGRFTRINPAKAKKLGLQSTDEALGKSQRDFLKPHQSSKIEAQEAEVLNSGRPLLASIEPVEFADGKIRWLSVTIVPLKDSTGAVTGLVSISRDISQLKRAEDLLEKAKEELEQRVAERTAMLSQSNDILKREIEERNRAEAALRESEEKYRLLFESNPHPMWVFDLETLKFLAVNRSAIQKYGYSEEEFLSMTILEIRPKEDWEAVRESIKAAGDSEANPTEWRHSTKDGTVIEVEIVSRPVVFNGRRARLVLAHDVSARNRAEAEVRRLNQTLEQQVEKRTAQLQASNKELEAFSYSVSHDLRAPLRQIAGFSKLLLEECSGRLDEKAQHYFQRVIEATDRMSTLIDHLLRLSRVTRQELVTRPADLNAVLRAALEDVGDGAENRNIQWDLGNLPVVACDPDLIRQVFTNLLSNALKFTRVRERAVIQVGQEAEQGQIVIFVKDNGVGFDMKYAGRLFAVFQRLHSVEDFEGTGVGLATVDRIIRKHGGEVWADSQPGKGATFYFKLGPIAREKKKEA
jgi:PAS domain S-box-containing protein